MSTVSTEIREALSAEEKQCQRAALVEELNVFLDTYTDDKVLELIKITTSTPEDQWTPEQRIFAESKTRITEGFKNPLLR